VPKYQQQPTAGAGGGPDLQYSLPDRIGTYNIKKFASFTSVKTFFLLPTVNPSLFALTVNQPLGFGYPPNRESSFHPTQESEFGASPTTPEHSNYPPGTVWDGAPVYLPPGALRWSACNINLQDQATWSSLTAPVQQLATPGLLANNIREPQYSSVSITTAEEDVLFDQHICNLHHFDDGEWKEQGGVRLTLLQDSYSKKVQLLMRREKVDILFVFIELFKTSIGITFYYINFRIEKCVPTTPFVHTQISQK